MNSTLSLNKAAMRLSHSVAEQCGKEVRPSHTVAEHCGKEVRLSHTVAVQCGKEVRPSHSVAGILLMLFLFFVNTAWGQGEEKPTYRFSSTWKFEQMPNVEQANRDYVQRALVSLDGTSGKSSEFQFMGQEDIYYASPPTTTKDVDFTYYGEINNINISVNSTTVNFGGTDCSGSTTKTSILSYNGPCTDVTAYMLSCFYVDFRATLVPTNMKLLPFTQSIALSANEVEIKAVEGYPASMYNWYYSLDKGSSWTRIGGKSGSVLKVSAADVFGTNWQLKHNQEVYFHVSYSCSNQDPVFIGSPCPMVVVAPSPTITDITVNHPKCHDERGSITVKLSRALLPNERVDVFLKHQATQTVTSLQSDNTFVIQNLQPGTYEELSISSYIRKSDMEGKPNPDDYLYHEGDDYKRENIIINNPPELTFELAAVIACYSENMVIKEIKNGSAPYTVHYSGPKSGSSSSLTISNLPEGKYNVYITDGNGCKSASEDIDIYPPEQPEITLDFSEAPSGYGRNDGSASISVSDYSGSSIGTGSLTHSGGKIYPPASSSNGGVFDFENLPAGNYTFTYTNSQGCPTTLLPSFTLSQPPQLVISLTSKNISCNGETDGQISATVSGGVLDGGSYTYDWEKQNGTAWDYYDDGNGSISDLEAGEYRLIVTDNSREPNKTMMSVTIAEPSIVEFDGAASVTANNLCYGDELGKAVINAKGGNGGYKAVLMKDEVKYRDIYFPASATTFTIEELPAGNYEVTSLTDKNGCVCEGSETSVTFIITQPAKPVTVELLPTNTTGYGRSDGKMVARITGGTPKDDGTYDVSWTNGKGIAVTGTTDIVEGVFTAVIENLPKELYEIAVKDKNNCAPLEAAKDSVRQPDPLVASLSPTPVLCFGELTGKVIADIKGGVPFKTGANQYAIQWFMIRPNEADSLLADQHSATLSGVSAGTYFLRVSDAVPEPALPNTSISDTVEVTQPTLLSITSIGSDSIACYGTNDGSIYLTVTGGVGGYKMFHKPAAGSDPFVETPPLADGTGFRIDSLFADTYTVYVTDANGCLAKIGDEEIHTVIVGQPDAPLGLATGSIRLEPSGYGLSNGSFRFIITGGTPFDDGSYTVEWRDSVGNVLTAANAVDGSGRYVSALEGLSKGKYSLVVKDKRYASAFSGKDAGCFFSAVYTLTEPTELKASLTETHYVTCHGTNDGALSFRVEGGVRNPDVTALSPYNIQWYKMLAGGDSIRLNMDSVNLEALSGGVYKVHIYDYSRIPNHIALMHELVEPDSLVAAATQADIICGETIDVTATVTGGTPPYRFEWSTGDTVQVLRNMVAGKYLVFITDSHGCQTTALSNITTPSDLVVTGDVYDPLCHDASNGSIELSVAGGRAPYTYKWNTGATSQTLSGIPSGNYNVVVTDADGCGAYSEFTLGNPAPISVSLGPDRIICLAQTALLQPTITDPKTTYRWTGPGGFTSTAPSVEADREGTYTVTITDGNGCMATDSVNVRLDELEISSEIVVASQVFVGDTVVIVNISDPVPESYEWLFAESDSLTVIERSEHIARVVFNIVGNYNIGLRTFVGECYADNIKPVAVHAADERNNDFYAETVIENFFVTPNPNNGDFTVVAKLNKVSPARIRIVNIGTGMVLSDQRYNGQIEYTPRYSLSLSGGIYAVILEASSGYMIVKMAVQ